MQRGTQAAEPLPAAHAEFIQTGVSIIAASRGPDLRPSMARAAGCRVSGDLKRVTLLLRSTRSEELLADLRRSGIISAVFCLPTTHRTIQLKGAGARIENPLPGDSTLIQTYTKAFAQQLLEFGYPVTYTQALIDSVPGDVVGVSFEPSAAFSQTPGPRAGERLP